VNSLQDIQEALQSTDEETRLRAVQILKGRTLQESGCFLFSAMGDESWRVRKEAVETFVASAPEKVMVDQLLVLLRNEDNAGLRNSAAEAVARIGVQAADALISLVDDSDADVRKFVIDVMGSINSPVFVPSLLTCLRDQDVNVAAAAAEHLGNLGDSRVVSELLRGIAANQADQFRFNALSAIGKLAAPAPVPEEIIQLAEMDLLRKSVYECLGSIADESAVALLLKGVTVRQKSSRTAAVMALYRIYSRSGTESRQTIESALQFFRGSDLVSALIDLFDLNDPALAEAIVVVLDIIGDKRSVRVLLQAYGNERLSGIALRALKHLGPAGADDLITRFAEADPFSRSAICTLIGECAYRNGRSVISDALLDQAAIVRSAAVAAAGKLGLTDCIPGIVRLLDDNNPVVRSTVVSCLQALALIDRGGIQAVAHQLVDSDRPEQRRDAAVLLAALGDGDRLSLLVKDEDALVRQAAVSSVGRLHLASACGILTIALVDENPDVRISAAEALADFGNAEVVTALTHALNDDDAWVQCVVLKSLAQICPEGILAAVQKVFDRAEGLLLITCLKLLENHGDNQAMELVERTLDNNDTDVVSLALSIIGRKSINRIAPHAARLLRHHSWDVRMACARNVALLPEAHAFHLLSQALEHETDELARIQLQDLLKGLA
jgi:HEAT repeat protein